MRSLMIDSFEFYLNQDDRVIGLICENPFDYRIILKPNTIKFNDETENDKQRKVDGDD